jgi:ABC-type Fe3+-hydroxamate transport system substrate-binding protein
MPVRETHLAAYKAATPLILALGNKKLMKFYLTGLWVVFAAPSLWADIQVIDDAGDHLTLEKPATRIVSLVPHATEMLFNIGAGDLIQATVAFADYPEAARQLPRVGDYNALNIEAIISLEPDLLIAFSSGANLAQINRLRQLGYPVFTSDPQTFPDIERTLRQFGDLTGRETSAGQTADAFMAGIAELHEMYANKRPLSVFYQVWDDPIITLNGDTFVSDTIRLCGGVNVFAELAMPSPQVSLEAVINKNPEVIVTGASDSGGDSLWDQWPQLQAVAHNGVIETETDTLHRPTPGLLTGAANLCASMDAVRKTYY